LLILLIIEIIGFEMDCGAGSSARDPAGTGNNNQKKATIEVALKMSVP
jgi:hypothetical protein